MGEAEENAENVDMVSNDFYIYTTIDFAGATSMSNTALETEIIIISALRCFCVTKNNPDVAIFTFNLKFIFNVIQSAVLICVDAATYANDLRKR